VQSMRLGQPGRPDGPAEGVCPDGLTGRVDRTG
jgi:hypothetical protein